MRARKFSASSAVEKVSYDDDRRTLSVCFRGGRRYIYDGVPPELYDALCAAESAGRFVNAAIKGCFPCRREPARRFYPA